MPSELSFSRCSLVIVFFNSGIQGLSASQWLSNSGLHTATSYKMVSWLTTSYPKLMIALGLALPNGPSNSVQNRFYQYYHLKIDPLECSGNSAVSLELMTSVGTHTR